MLRNRMMAAASTPHFLQGKEEYFTEKWITHMANRARNGAAAVCINHIVASDSHILKPSEFVFNTPEQTINDTGSHFCEVNLYDRTCQNYACQMVDAIHFYGAKASAYLPQFIMPVPDYIDEKLVAPPSPGGVSPEDSRPLVGPKGSFVDQLKEDYFQAYIDKCCEVALICKKLGFDMVGVHCAYLGSVQAALLSPKTNTRTDEYGCSIENRARFLLRMFSEMKKVLGQDFPLEAVVSGEEPGGGITLDDSIALAKLAEGTIDILTIRSGELDPQHPTGFTSTPENPTPYLHLAEAVKASGTRTIISASAGFQNLSHNERVIAEGKADLISMARAWICDPEYGKKAYEGRGEDVIPCIRCNKCHVPDDDNKFRSFCSVNPVIGFEDKLDRMFDPPSSVKNVAVVGGGPAGMKAAITASERGHRVTLFEKAEVLGGLLTHSDYAEFKWPLRDFKNYLIRELYKSGCTVKLSTTVTREILEDGGFDEVVLAIGPVMARPDIPGSDGESVLDCMSVFGRVNELPKTMVVIGGSETGTEVGMYLAENGIKTTVMTRQGKLAPGAAHSHYATMLEAAYKALPDFHWITGVQRYISIGINSIEYIDAQGEKQTIPTEAVVLCTGAKANTDGVIELFSPKYKTCLAGDCDIPGDVHRAVASGLFTACCI